MVESGRIKVRWFEVVYMANWDIKVKDNSLEDWKIWNTHYKVLGLTFCGKELSYVKLMAYPKLWRWFIHHVIYATAGSQIER